MFSLTRRMTLIAVALAAAVAICLPTSASGLGGHGDFARNYQLVNDPSRSLTLIKETNYFWGILGITPMSSCKVKLDDGKIIDLTSLDNAANPKSDPEGDFIYKFNPCSPFQCKDDDTAALCQVNAQGTGQDYNLGDQSTYSFSYDNELTMMFEHGSRKSVITCRCDEKLELLKFIRESPTLTYNLEFTSKCCCPDKCSGKKPPSGPGSGLTFGSILCIIFFSLIVVYFIGGILFMKFAKQKSGKEMIPNIGMWSELPGNIKEGFSFVIGKARGGNGGYQPV